MAEDPVHEEDGKWYYWTETQADRNGPFDTEIEARRFFKVYCEWLEEKRRDG